MRNWLPSSQSCKSESPTAEDTTPESKVSPIIEATLCSKGVSSSTPLPLPVLPTLCRCAAVLRLTSTFISDHFFLSSFTVRLSDPTALTASAKLSHSYFFLLLLIPEDNVPNKICFLVSTSDSSTSNSLSVKFRFLPLALAIFLLLSFAKVDSLPYLN